MKYILQTLTILLLSSVVLLAGCASGGSGDDDNGTYRDASGNPVFSRYSTMTVTSSEDTLTTYGIKNNGPTQAVILIETATDVFNASPSATVRLSASFIDATNPAIGGGFINASGQLVNELQVTTNRYGRAEVLFQAPVQPVDTVLIYSQMIEQPSLTDTTPIHVVAGPIDYTQSKIISDSASCVQLPQDSSLATSESLAEITVYITDSNGNAIDDITSVTLEVSDGLLADSANRDQEILDYLAYQQNPNSSRWFTYLPGSAEPVLNAPTIEGSLSAQQAVNLINGRGTVKFIAPSDSNISAVQFKVVEEPKIATLTLPIVTAPTNAPNSIKVVSISSPSIYVAGSSNETTSLVSLIVRDTGGYAIDETSLYHDPSLNNLRITLFSGPGGGEYITGRAADLSTVSSLDNSSHSIDIRTKNGYAEFMLTSGTLPGPVELRAEVLYTTDGQPQTPPLYVSLPQHVILSGKPDVLSISWPSGADTIEDLGNGFYSRVGYLVVTDHYGHAAADNTPVYLSVTDTTLAQGSTGQIANSTLTDSSRTTSGNGVLIPTGTETFDTTTINRVVHGESFQYHITPGTTLSLLSANSPSDRIRYVHDVGSQTVTTTQPFTSSESNLEYRLSRSTLGTRVYGVTSDGLVPGEARLHDGVAEFRVVYPVAGLLNYGNYLTSDTRFTPAWTTRVQLLAEIAQQHIAVANGVDFAFEPRKPYTLSFLDSAQSAITIDASPATVTYNIKLSDASSNRIPFETVNVSFQYPSSEAPTWNNSSRTWTSNSACYQDNDNEITEYDLVKDVDNKEICENTRHGSEWVTTPASCSNSKYYTKETCEAGDAGIWDAANSTCSNPKYFTEETCLAGDAGIWTDTTESCSNPYYLTKETCEAGDFGVWYDAGTCSDPAYTSQATCEAGYCSNPIYTTQETCEAGHSSELTATVVGSTSLDADGVATIQVNVSGSTVIANDSVNVIFSFEGATLTSTIQLRN